MRHTRKSERYNFKPCANNYLFVCWVPCAPGIYTDAFLTIPSMHDDYDLLLGQCIISKFGERFASFKMVEMISRNLAVYEKGEPHNMQ